MGFAFNPFTGNFDAKGSGGGGASYIDGEVQNFSALPETLGTPAVDSAYLVREAEGTWLLNRKPAGIYIRTANTGTRASDWTYAGEFPDVFNDANLVVYNNTDSTKNVKFDASAIATGTTRTITVPDKNITLDDAGDSRTPSSHSSSHASAGSDPLAPSDIGAQSVFTTITPSPSDTPLTANRARNVAAIIFSAGNIRLPDTNNLAGDIFVVFRAAGNTDANIQRFDSGTQAWDTIGSTSEGQTSYIWSGQTWLRRAVDAHTHAASAITSGTLTHERGGLEADVSAYDGLVKISGGSTSAVGIGTGSTEVAAGDHGHGNINSSGQVGTTANLPLKTGTGGIVETGVFGTGAGEFAEGNHTHADLHTRSHAITSTSDHTAGNHKVFYSNGSGEIVELALGNSGEVLTSNGATSAPSFAAASGGIGGGTGSTDNAILRADGTGGSTAQSSDIVIDDATTSTQANVALRNNHSETNSALVLSPKGTGALIGGARPDGVAAVGGNARGSQAIDLQLERSAATQVASGTRAVAIGTRCTASGQDAVAIGRSNTANQVDAVCIGGSSNTAGNSSIPAVVVGGQLNSATGAGAVIIGGGINSATGQYSTVLNGRYSEATRYGQLSYQGREFSTASLFRGMWSRFWMATTTTNNTAKELSLQGINSLNRLTIPSGRTMACVINICATTSGGEFANNYIRQFVIANRSGTTALRGSVQTIGTDIEGIDLTNPEITANDTNDAVKVDFYGTAPVTGCTADASTDVISKTAHGFSDNDDIIFTSLTGGAGLTLNTQTYWVRDATADTFKVSTTRGGAAVNITTDYTDMTATRSWRVVAYVDAVEIDHGV